MIQVISSDQLTSNADLICTHCGQEFHLINFKEGVDYVFERKGKEEWCICTSCKEKCDKNNWL